MQMNLGLSEDHAAYDVSVHGGSEYVTVLIGVLDSSGTSITEAMLDDAARAFADSLAGPLGYTTNVSKSEVSVTDITEA